MVIPRPLEGIVGEGRNIQLTSEDRLAAEQLADLLGVPSGQLIEEFEQLTPKEWTEFEQAIDKVNEVLPGMHASLDRIEQGIARCSSRVRDMRAQMSGMSDRLSQIEEAIGIAEVTSVEAG